MPAYPLIEFVLSIGTWDTEGEAYPDTGFEGGLTIPAGMGREVRAAADTVPLRMADGTVLGVRMWRGSLDLGGGSRAVDVVALGNRFLIGREVLDEMEICFRFGQELTLRFER